MWATCAVLSTRTGNQTCSPGERCFQANRRTIASTRTCSVSWICRPADSVGRLEPVPDTAQVDEPFAHTNRHHHAPTSYRPNAFCSRARPIDPAATQTCSADVGAASGTQRPQRIRAWGEVSPLRHSNGLRPGHRSSLSGIGREPVLDCITLAAPVCRAHLAVLFSLAMQEVFFILSS